MLIWDDPEAELITCFSLSVNNQVLLDTQTVADVSTETSIDMDLVHGILLS
jgi:hypothetical protein